MGRLSLISHRELVVRLQRLGFSGPFAGSRHPLMVRGERRITVPNFHGIDIGVDLLSHILRQAGISRKEWESVE